MTDTVEGMLTARQARVLGSLMEKQMTTPNYYPLTLKALTAACNQKSSRAPVMNLSESEVGGVVNELRAEGLVTARMDGRADRFEQHLSRKLGLTTAERAVLCVLLLRGALTLNEIRTCTGRMVSFDSADALEQLLAAMGEREQPLLQRMPRAPGQREDRYVQLLCGRPAAANGDGDASSPAGGDAARLAQLEQDLAELRAEVRRLRALVESEPGR